jgi:hypothetical protein
VSEVALSFRWVISKSLNISLNVLGIGNKIMTRFKKTTSRILEPWTVFQNWSYFFESSPLKWLSTSSRLIGFLALVNTTE